MNRAWIPAGALAGLSVAGLIALGPLTSSMGTKVDFPDAITTPGTSASHPGNSRAFLPVSLNVNEGVRGQTKTAGLSRGAQATAPSPTSGDFGFVSTQIHKQKPTVKSSSSATSSTAKAKSAAKPKKSVTKRTPIGTTGETNSSDGLAGGGSGSTSTGEQTQTPSSSGN